MSLVEWTSVNDFVRIVVHGAGDRWRRSPLSVTAVKIGREHFVRDEVRSFHHVNTPPFKSWRDAGRLVEKSWIEVDTQLILCYYQMINFELLRINGRVRCRRSDAM